MDGLNRDIDAGLVYREIKPISFWGLNVLLLVCVCWRSPFPNLLRTLHRAYLAVHVEREHVLLVVVSVARRLQCPTRSSQPAIAMKMR
jgi:hypothetical protein